jgi:16S rRNA (cytidine1402-2'-O)-methyltransferase
MAGTLYVVSTPIGNLEDVTLRALRVLRDTQWIACEDPRRTRQLLAHYAIDTPLTTYHQTNNEEKTPVLIAALLEGKNVALVCDAGTPVVFDPGLILIARAVASGISVVPVPGPSAPLAAAVVSALPLDAFIIHGSFPDRPATRARFLNALRDEPRTLILLVQPGGVRPILQVLRPVLGRRRLVLARNVTMPDEQFLRGAAADLLRIASRETLTGELTLVIEGAKKRSRRGTA